MIALRNTDRGFSRGEFWDRYNRPCSIQESSLATEQCIWLGCDEGNSVRMHLTQAMAAELIPLMQHFVETGRLS